MTLDYEYRGIYLLVSGDLDALIDRLLAAEAALATVTAERNEARAYGDSLYARHEECVSSHNELLTLLYKAEAERDAIAAQLQRLAISPE